MKICLISSSFPRFADNGSELLVYQGIFVYELAQYLVQRGHEVHVVTPMYPGAKAREIQDGITIWRFVYYGWQHGWILSQLKQIPVISMLSYVIAAIWLARRVIRQQELELIHAYWVVPAGFISVIVSWLTGVPVAATTPGSDLNIWPRRWLPRQLVRFTLRRLDVLFTLGTGLRDAAINLGANCERIVVNLGDGGMNLDLLSAPGIRIATRKSWGVSDDAPVILYVGSLHPPKRIDHLLQATKYVTQQIPTARLCIVGSGSLETELRQLQDELGLAQVVSFLGYKPHSEVPALLEAADLFVYPTDSEGLPSAVMEALAMGVPVVASGVGGLPDLIVPGETGYLSEAGDIDGLSRAILAVLGNQALAQQMGLNGKAFAKSSLDKEVIMPRIEASYKAILNNGYSLPGKANQ